MSRQFGHSYHEWLMEKVAQSEIFADSVSFYKTFVAKYSSCTVLDLGAGSGTVAKYLAKLSRVRQVVAFDLNKEAMRNLIESGKVQKCDKGTADSLPFGDQMFEVVICRYAFHHFNRQPRVLQEVARVLKREVTFLWSDAIMPEHSRDVLEAIYRVREQGFFRFLTYHEIMQTLECSGLQPALVRPYAYRHGSLDEFCRSLKDELRLFSTPRQRGTAETILRERIIRAWSLVDSRVRKEMKVRGHGNRLSFAYPLADVAAMKAV